MYPRPPEILNVSIHAPARGATFRLCPDLHLVQVSIHAPARGATITTVTQSVSDTGFNPRSREGSDFKTDGRRPG